MTDNVKKLYLIVRGTIEMHEDVLAVFDNEERAQSFIDRFKTPSESDLIILEQDLNPVFHADKTKDPYFVLLRYKGDADECYRVDDLKESNAAFHSGYEYACTNRKKLEDVDLFVYVLATSETSAIKQSKVIRKNLIDSGDWEKNWLEYQKGQN